MCNLITFAFLFLQTQRGTMIQRRLISKLCYVYGFRLGKFTFRFLNVLSMFVFHDFATLNPMIFLKFFRNISLPVSRPKGPKWNPKLGALPKLYGNDAIFREQYVSVLWGSFAEFPNNLVKPNVAKNTFTIIWKR